MSFKSNPNIEGSSKNSKKRRFSGGFDGPGDSRPYNKSSPQENIGPAMLGNYANNGYGGHSRSPVRRPRDNSGDGAPQEFYFTSNRVQPSRRRDSRSRSRSPRATGTGHVRGASTYRPDYYTEERPNRYQATSSPPPSVNNNPRDNTHALLTRSPHRDQHPFPKKDQSSTREGPSTPGINPPSDPLSALMVDKGKEEKGKEIDAVETAHEFGLLLTQIIVEATNSAELKIQKTAAAKEFERKDSDYKKSKSARVHEKFPATEETQRRSREAAEKALKAISEKAERKDAVLKDLAIQSASRLVPAIISAKSQSTSSSQDRIEELEKTCKYLQRQVQEQKTYVEEQRKARIELERKHNDLSTKAIDRVSQSEKIIKSLTDELMSAANITSRELLRKGLKQKFDKLDSLATRIDSFGLNQMRLDLSKVKKESDDITKKVDGCVKSMEGYEEKAQSYESLDLKNLNKTLEENSKTIKDYQQKYLILDELIRGVVTAGGRTPGLTGSVSKLRKDLETFQSEMKKMQESSSSLNGLPNNAPAAAPSPVQTRNEDDSAFIRSLSTRIESVEAKIKSVPTMDEIVTAIASDEYTKDLQEFKDQLTLVEEERFPELLKAIEEHQRLTTQHLNNLSSNLTPRLETLEKGVESMNADSNKDDSLQKKLASLETESKKLSSINQSVTEVEKDISLLKSISIQSKLSAIEDRLGVLERQPRPEANSSPSNPEIAPATTPSSAPDLDVLKSELLRVVQNQQDVADGVMGDLITGLQTSVQALQARCTTVEKGLSDLKPAEGLSLETIQKLQDSQKLVVTELKTELEDAKKSLAAISADQAIKILQAQPDLLPLAHLGERVYKNIEDQLNVKLNNFSRSAGDINKIMNERLDATEFGIKNLDTRMTNINTKDMANFMLGQLESAYPNLRDAQTTITNLQAFMGSMKAELDHLALAVNALETRPNQSTDVNALDSLKFEVDKLTKSLSEIESTAKAAYDGIGTVRAEHDQYQMDIATELAHHRLEIEGLQKDLDALKAKHPFARETSASAASAPPMQAPSRTSQAGSPARSMSNGNIGRAPARPAPLASNQRSISIMSDSSNKKRKLHGSMSSIGSSSATGLGVTNGLNGSSRKGRKPRGFGDGDDSDDEDFEPTQPRINSDDEE